VIATDPPLDPSGDEARSLLERELAHPDYHQHDVVGRVLDWIDRLLDGTVDVTHASPLSTFAAILTFLLLTLGLGWLVTRAQRGVRAGARPGPVLADPTLTADQLRAAAEQALAEGRDADALVDGFRALTRRQVERGGLEDRPDATAHEVAVALATSHPDQHLRVATSANLFDAVRYGDRPASHDQAAEVLTLDDAMAGRR
jgi:hypothetical protein